jgi:lysozyme
MSASDITAQRLNTEEGRRKLPYRDSKGLLTIGVGINLDAGLDDEEIDWLLQHRLSRVADRLMQYDWYRALNDARKSVFLDLGFNMGVDSLLHFVNTIAKTAAGDYAGAASNLLLSKWRSDVGDGRALPLAHILETGEI